MQKINRRKNGLTQKQNIQEQMEFNDNKIKTCLEWQIMKGLLSKTNITAI